MLEKCFLFRRLPPWLSAAVFLVACWAHTAALAQSGACPKLALLVGNASYKAPWKTLDNADNDAQDLGQRLELLGWKTKVETNRTLSQMQEDVGQFIERVQQANACQMLVYFSGHGLEWSRGAYLIPVDLQSDKGTVVEDKAMSLQQLVNKLQRPSGLKLVMVDACRTRPGTKGNKGGLPNPEAEKPLPSDVLIAYASEAMQPALDSGKRNGVYASGLLKVLQRPAVGGGFYDVMAEVEEEVRQISREYGRQQNPKFYGGASAGRRFSFVQSPAPAAPIYSAAEDIRKDEEIAGLKAQLSQVQAPKITPPQKYQELGIATMGLSMATNRRIEQVQLEDESIELKARDRITNSLSDRAHVNVTSYNRLLLLSGEVPSQQDKQTVEKIAEGVESVLSVVNELVEMEQSTLVQRSSDVLLTAKDKAALIDAKDIVANAYKLVSERGTVYAMGRVTQREAKRATEVMTAVAGVRRLVRVFEIISEKEIRRDQTAKTSTIAPLPDLTTLPPERHKTHAS